jgi:hypothetical protein
MNQLLGRFIMVGFLVGTVVASGTVVSASAAPARKFPDLVGAWKGSYRFPAPDDKGVDSHEKLVIDHQDGELIWGYDEYVEADGTDMRIPVRGSIDFDRRGFGLAENGGMFLGRIKGKNRITVRFFLTTTNFTSFDAKLTRSASSS